ncbi:MAG: hypothetical protein P8N31_09570 [Planctomycetota bacterium]|nr:hypothetical protein [Planctomycetota bacterium]MDG2143792.1 hypothetical protein [Planctomycetota bacterium]
MFSKLLLHAGIALVCTQTNASALQLQGPLPKANPGTASEPIVGLLTLETPSVDQFTLHGTLPVPPGTFLGTEATTPLSVLDHNGQPVPTQLEVVAWHPKDGDGAAVVEVIAQVERYNTTMPDQGYRVQLKPQPRKIMPAKPNLADLLAAPENLPNSVRDLLIRKGQVILATEDVFGNVYVLDLMQDSLYDQGAREVKRYGKVQTEFRHHGIMRPLSPVTGPKATLPHFFGVHAYFRCTADDPAIELDLRIHNGADGNTDGPVSNEALGDLYFTQMVLLIPPTWLGKQNYEDPGLGATTMIGNYRALPLVAPNADGTMHYFPKQGQMERRISLAPITGIASALSHANDEGQAFARPGPLVDGKPVIWSWWKADTATYFPQRHLLPRLDQIKISDFRKDLSAEYQEINGHIENGTGQGSYPYESNVLGWAHPFGVAYGGMSGGDGIFFTWGVRTLIAGSREGYRRLQLMHRMNTDRQPNALYRYDGSPSNIYDWLVTKQGVTYLPTGYYMHPTGTDDPFGFKTAPTFQSDYVKAQGLTPSYEQSLSGYAHIDIQHLVRYTGPAKALVWVGNDSLAKDDLEHQAELFHLSYQQHDNSFYGHIQGTGLKADQEHVKAHPGEGLDFGRGEGWGVDVMAAAYSTGDEAFRKEKMPWFKAIAELLSDGQDQCTGIIESKTYVKFLDGKYRGRQVTEMSIVENALVGVIRSVLQDEEQVHNDMLRAVLINSLYALIAPGSWDPANSAPWSELATGPADPDLPPFCWSIPVDGRSPYTNDYQQWASLAYGVEFTGDEAFLIKAQKMLGAPLVHMVIDDKLPNLGNRSAMHALIEYLIGVL